MSFLGGIGDIVEDVVGGVVDIGEDIVEGAIDITEGALSGDPNAIATLALTIYSGGALYGALSAGTAFATTTAAVQTVSQVASITGTLTGNEELAIAGGIGQAGTALYQSTQQAAISEAVKEGGPASNIENVAKQKIDEQVAQSQTQQASAQSTPKTFGEELTEGLKDIVDSPISSLAFQGLSILSTPDVAIPEITPAPRSELYDYSPTVRTGADDDINRATGGETSSQFQNINTLGRLV